MRTISRIGLGTALSASNTLAIGSGVRNPVRVLPVWNEQNDPDLGFDAGWVPTLDHELLPARTTAIPVPLLSRPQAH